MSVVFLAAEVERLALFPAFAAPRRLAGALAVLGHRLAGLAGHAGAQRIGIDRGVAVAILDAATGAGGDDDGKQDWKAHAGDPFVRRGPRLCRRCAKEARPGTKRCCRSGFSREPFGHSPRSKARGTSLPPTKTSRDRTSLVRGKSMSGGVNPG